MSMSSEEMIGACLEHTMFSWSATAKLDPLAIARAEGVYLYTPEGKRILEPIKGKLADTLREMREEMASASARLDFEHAAVLRDQIKAIEKLDERETRGDWKGDDAEFDWQPEATGFVQDPAAGARSLARVLGAEQPIRCLEAFDIAHLRGGETVASKVCFIDGKPFKEGYRRFRIQTVSNDDFSAMREVISRRFRDAGEGEELYPDLILIDGGIGQLNAALEAFAQLRVQPPRVISLSKKEELLHLPGVAEPIRLGREPRSSRDLGIEVVRMIEAVDSSLANEGARIELASEALVA